MEIMIANQSLSQDLAKVAPLYEKVRTVIPDVEWPVHARYVARINELKKERNAVILAHNYQTPRSSIALPISRVTRWRWRAGLSRRRRHHRPGRCALHGRDGQAAQPGQDRADSRRAGRVLAGGVDYRGGYSHCARSTPVYRS